MFTQAISFFIYTAVIMSLFFIDFILGNGFVGMLQKFMCRMICFIRRSVREDAKTLFVSENPINVPVFFIELLILGFTIAVLNKYKQSRVHMDRMNFLLQESKDALRQTNEFLEKWRVPRVPAEYSYLYNEPREIKPLNLEEPILHMAIIDSLGTTRNKPERGHAGDTINITDSKLPSVTSLIDDDVDSIPEVIANERIDDLRITGFRNRWNTMKESIELS